MERKESKGLRLLTLSILTALLFFGLSVGPVLAGCGPRDESASKTCKNVRYKALPPEVKKLMARIGCDVKTGSNYDYGYAVDLNSDGSPEYAFCCTESRHGPCGMAIFGKSAGQWKVLTDSMHGMDDGKTPCYGFVVLKKKSSGYNDICVDDGPGVMRFKNGVYNAE